MGGTSDFTPWNDIIDLHPKYDRLITDLIFEKHRKGKQGILGCKSKKQTGKIKHESGEHTTL
jgi:hypothetical protein